MHLVGMYCRSRSLPLRHVAVEVRDGLFLAGFMTSDVLTGVRGLLNHIYQNHGKDAGMFFLSAVQRLTTTTSLYGYCPSVGLDDCLFPTGVRTGAHALMERAVEAHRSTCQTSPAGTALPYRVDDEDSEDAIISRLTSLRAASETLVARYALAPRRRRGVAGHSASAAGQTVRRAGPKDAGPRTQSGRLAGHARDEG